MLARNSYLPLVKAGEAMPRVGEVQKREFHLYCTDPRDGIAKFQFCSPRRPGKQVRPNEPRASLETATISVDPNARPFQERLELDVKVDEDLILSAHARSLNARDQDQREVHNLEFGLALPTPDFTAQTTDTSNAGGSQPTPYREALAIRVNVSNERDPSLVPGELLYQYDPHYFSVLRHPPEVQVEERLYYEPCAGCGRASNDPLCTCPR